MTCTRCEGGGSVVRYACDYPVGMQTCERCGGTGDDSGKLVSELRAENATLRSASYTLRAALYSIARLAHNQPDANLTDRTGPNDAAHRGLLYCHARHIARCVLTGAPLDVDERVAREAFDAYVEKLVRKSKDAENEVRI